MRYPITILGEIHFSYRVIFELLKNNIIPDTIIIKESNFAKIDVSIFNIEDTWTNIYKDYHLNWRHNLIDCCKKHSIKLFITNDIQSVVKPNKYLIVAGFSTILKNSLLQFFETPLNIHPSILPHFRGPQPEAQMIFNNQDYFGVTIHLITKQIDSGDIYFQQELPSQKMNIYELEITEGKIASQGIEKILLNKNEIRKSKKTGSYFSFLKNEELCVNEKTASEINELLRLLPEEFPYLKNGEEIIYPIELSNKETKKAVDTGVEIIYLTKWRSSC